ncbi:cation:proton antiporter [Cryptosporangium phraense]|uniref:Sodium:proton antiporter n=1 Tax=Cryptosporangium phraense TaxID=2593070 RepID=A0A545AIC9_9ACTN|nr:sodium:proton antiporter [Cryptosporangium phraense]TQS41071.1 sodium:proton antiporter [Cryptosporangium phraense]
MNAGILLVLLALGAIAISAFGRHLNAQPGLLILVAAAGASFIPGLPRLELDPELILGLVVPPLLYAATLEFSFFSFMRNIRSILGLGVVLVLLSAFLGRLTTEWLMPSLGAGVALLLASIVAPPDTVTVSAHGSEIGLTRRVTAILTGESLVNDAMALTLFSVALASVGGEETFVDNGVLLFFWSALVGIVIGFALGNLATAIRRRLDDPTLGTAVGLVLPFATYLAAEEAHASGVLAVVCAGFNVAIESEYGNRKRERLGFRTRMTEREVWPVLGALLEAFVFAYTGLQLRFIIDDLRDSGEPIERTVLTGVALLVVVILARFAWVAIVFGRRLLANQAIQKRLEDPLFRKRWDEGQARLKEAGRPPRDLPEALGWKEQVLLSWTGMRGIVTLGAAGGIPLLTEDGTPFPHRDTLQFLAYFVVFGTLLLQAPTLPLLARWLKIDTSEEDRAALEQLALAEKIAADAKDGKPHPVADPPGRQNRPNPRGRSSFRDRRARAVQKASAPDDGSPLNEYDRQRVSLSLAVIQRDVEDEAAQVVLTRIDRQQAAAESP